MNQEKVGRFIRELRIEKEMTQQELAEKLGVTDSAISKWENGRGAPDISYLIPLSNELNITILELLNGEKGKDDGNALIKLIEETNRKKRIWKYITLGISNICLIIMSVVFIFGYIIPMIYENSDSKGMEIVRSASMEPTIKLMTGFIYDKVDIEDVKKDDIIVYNWTDENGAFLASPNGNVRVIHRVVEITKDDNGNVSLITRGDNNLEDDKIPVTSHNFVGIYNHKTSYLTTFFLKQNIQNYPGVFIFLMISISIVICFDIIQFIKYLIKRASV